MKRMRKLKLNARVIGQRRGVHAQTFIRVKQRLAFSLPEALAALALFALAAYGISSACFGIVSALQMRDKDPDSENLLERAYQAISAVSNYDSLDDGIEIESLDGESYRVYAETEPTQIIDLFRLDFRIEGQGKDISRSVYVIRPKWYQESTERSDLLRDRTDFLEDKRQTEAFNKKK